MASSGSSMPICAGRGSVGATTLSSLGRGRSGEPLPPVDSSSLQLPMDDDRDEEEMDATEIRDDLEKEDENGNAFRDSTIYMAISMKGMFTNGKTVGVAYYNSDTDTIHSGEFIDLDGRILASVKWRLKPQVIITHARAGDEIFELLRSNELDELSPFNVTSVKKAEFNYDGSKHRLKLLSVNELERSEAHRIRVDGDDFAQDLKLMSIVNFEMINMVSALGGLLSYLQRNRIVNQLDDENVPISVASIRGLDLPDIMIVDNATLRSLNIIQRESHPGGSTSRKEGLSVFRMLDETKTAQGKRTLKSWLTNPTLCKETILSRHSAIEQLLDPRNEHWMAEVCLILRSVKDINRLVGKVQNVKATCNDWISITETIQQFIYLQDLACSEELDFIYLKKVIAAWDDEITELNNLITSVIDFPSSKQSGRLEIRPGVSEEVDTLKLDYEDLGPFLTKVAQEMSPELQESVRTFDLLHLPQLGYLISIPVDPLLSIESQAAVEGLIFQFTAENQIYFKNDRTIQLDQDVGDIRGMIIDLEAGLVRELADLIVAARPTLRALSTVIAELDCLVSLAVSAANYSLVRPRMVKENCILIKGGFHLLQSQTVDQFIPNETMLSDADGEKPIMILTGPNGSGKSVLLKQVGIIVYLAQCGSFVPAEWATLGLTDHIFCRMDYAESINHSLSTFANDCNQMSYMLKHATSHSLLLIDEYGKGTCREDGIALLASTINYLASRRITDCPHVMLTTHFHELFSMGLLQEENPPHISFGKMDIVTRQLPATASMPESPMALNHVTFLYRLTEGVSMHSYGVECAAIAGLPEDVIQRAMDVSQSYMTHEPIQLVDSGDPAKFANIFRDFVDLDMDDVNQVAALMRLIRE